MRPYPFEPMTAEEFVDALAAARRGETLTDQGTTDEVQAALDAVAEAAPNPPARLIEAARAAFAATQ